MRTGCSRPAASHTPPLVPPRGLLLPPLLAGSLAVVVAGRICSYRYSVQGVLVAPWAFVGVVTQCRVLGRCSLLHSARRAGKVSADDATRWRSNQRQSSRRCANMGIELKHEGGTATASTGDARAGLGDSEEKWQTRRTACAMSFSRHGNPSTKCAGASTACSFRSIRRPRRGPKCSTARA